MAASAHPEPGGVYAELVASAPDAMLLVASDGTIRLANPESLRIFGYAENELVGRTVDQLVPIELRPRHAGHRKGFNAHAKRRPMGSGLDLEAQRSDGSRVPVEISLSPVASGSETLVLAIVRDVSQRRAAEATIQQLTQTLASRIRHLESLNSELESFSYSVSHDLRTPLRAIDGFSLALIEDFGDKLDDNGRHYLDRVRAGAQRMAQLIDDLLVLSRISRVDLQPAPVNVSDLAGLVVRETQADDPTRDVEFEIDPDLVLVADSRQLRVVLQNLIGNAWKFTSKQPWAHIRISAATMDGEPAVEVSDNGPGFNEEYAERMFGAFQRLHSAEEYPGTGVGLAIVQRIMLRHGGRVTASSRPGGGASFIFRTTGGTEPPSVAPSATMDEVLPGSAAPSEGER